MDTLIKVLVFVGAFIGMVLVHELGHFLAARLCKIKVKEFGIGLPPRIFTMFRQGGTDFTLNWLPLGGFVLPEGENDPNMPGGLAAAKPGARLTVILAGVAMNLLAGVLLMSVLVYRTGQLSGTVVLQEIMPASPAEQAGLRAGDAVLAVDDTRITDTVQLQAYVRAHLDQPVTLFLERDGAETQITVTPLSSRVAEGQGAIGFTMSLEEIRSEPYPSWFAAWPAALDEFGYLIRQLVTLPADLIRGNIAPEYARVVGLKGIFDITSAAVDTDLATRDGAPGQRTYYTLSLIVMLNVSIAVFNLLPFPALDGARALFILPELILRRRIPAHIENAVHSIGMALLLAFMLYVNVMDFVNPAQISLP